MFKNKLLLAVAIFTFLGVIIYSLQNSNIESFDEQTKKDRLSYENNILNDSQNIISPSTHKGFKYFEPNEKYLIEADYEPLAESKTMLTMTDSTTVEMKAIGKASFDWEGKKVSVLVFDEGEILMIPFKDQTNAIETYGGGRYVNIPKENLKGKTLEIDFNKAHNFYCAYNPNFICPIPPPENTLPISILAGEKSY